MMKIIECVPNFSEGRDKDKVASIVEAASGVSGVKVIDFSMDSDHNRSVLTIIGTPEDVERGAAAACDRALKLIDMRKHSGIHPRIGAVDVVPFVPIRGADMKEAVEAAHRFGRAFGERNNIPVYFYGEAALDPKRRELSDIRRGGYEGLSEKMKDPLWIPDAGPAIFSPRGGAVSVGARNPLIAFNINLDTNDLDVAKTIAKSVRYSSGGLKYVKAISIPLKSRHIVQVSMNLANYKETSVKKVFDTVKEKASEHGVEILESELIGLIPEAALEDVTTDYLKLSDFSPERIIETHLPRSIDTHLK
ncbi:MAG: glutamate formimidoyltransferase [Proteobacteria bacterium]|nr:glutamate formimidoyltransferase [Pseudomonadota bacterium]